MAKKIGFRLRAGMNSYDGYIVVNSPEAATTLLAEKEFEVGLLIGGGRLNSSFYMQGLIDEVWVTINPFILGKGRPFIGTSDMEVPLKLKKIIELSKGLVQLRYSVSKSLE